MSNGVSRAKRLPPLDVAQEPLLGDILSHRSIWVLAQLSKDGKSLKGTHYSICLVGGKEPLWGVWTISGKPVGKFDYRHEIEASYPNHVWRRHQARWHFYELAEKETVDRRNYALAKYGE